jgi:hypothetical protein
MSKKYLEFIMKYIAKSIFISSVFLLGGCFYNDNSKPPKEGLLLSHITKTKLPQLQLKAKSKKEVLLFGKKCLSKATTKYEANLCNKKVLKKDSEFDIDNFDKWDEKEKQSTLKIIDKNIKFMDCLIDAVNISQAVECREPWQSVTGI